MNEFDASREEYVSTHFTGLNLSREHITSMLFEDCTFADCTLTGIVFDECRLTQCTFTNCDLSLGQWKATQFRDVGFTACKMIGIDWTKADWPRKVLFSPLRFDHCLLNDSSMFGLALKEIVMRHCTAHDVDFRDGSFIKADFTGTDFHHSLFGSANLTEADFSDAIDYDIDVRNAVIRRAKFSRFEAMRLLDSLDIELVG